MRSGGGRGGSRETEVSIKNAKQRKVAFRSCQSARGGIEGGSADWLVRPFETHRPLLSQSALVITAFYRHSASRHRQ